MGNSSKSQPASVLAANEEMRGSFDTYVSASSFRNNVQPGREHEKTSLGEVKFPACLSPNSTLPIINSATIVHVGGNKKEAVFELSGRRLFGVCRRRFS